MTLKTCCVALVLALAAVTVMAQEPRTLKERLSDKASDAQRVDNCHVPVERRGPVPRPDCTATPRLQSPAVETGSSAVRRRSD